MEIQSLDKHMACFCYGAGKGALIEMRELPCGTQENINLSAHEIVFLLEGQLNYTVCGYNRAELTGGNLTFLPIGCTVNLETQANSVLFIFRRTSGLHLCHTFSIEQLYNKEDAKSTSKKIIPLKINPRLQHYLKGLKDTCTDGVMCRHFFEAKITELFVLLRTYYSDEQLRELFLPILSPDTEFSEFVRKNHSKYKTVNDMAVGMNLTPVQFSNRFRRVFQQPPREWIQQEKAKMIHADICESNRPLKQIADDYDFAVQAHLNRFCKRSFGMTPREMREKKTDKMKTG